MHPVNNEQYEEELLALNSKIDKQELDLWTIQRKLEAIGAEMKREESLHLKTIAEDMVEVSGKQVKTYKNELERNVELERRLDNSKSYLEMKVNTETLKEQLRDGIIALGSSKRVFKIHEIISRRGD